jgi:cell division inhibitor SulA
MRALECANIIKVVTVNMETSATNHITITSVNKVSAQTEIVEKGTQEPADTSTKMEDVHSDNVPMLTRKLHIKKVDTLEIEI